jgi:hypothetical protein
MKFILHIMQHRPKAVLFFLFFITLLIRIPQLTRPLSKHHELNTAAVLISMEVWNEKGLAFSHGASIHMYPGVYNIFKVPNNPYPNLFNSGTYLSIGPMSYMLPWAVFKLLHISPGETALRIFTLLLQLLSVFLFYQLVKMVFKTLFRRNLTDYKATAFNTSHFHVIAITFFLFSPAIMWYMGNAYCHEVLVLPMFLAALIYGFTIVQSQYKWSVKNYLVYGVVIAAAVYTDWLGCAIALVFFIQALSLKQFKQRVPFLLVNAVAVSIPVVLIFWQYISLIGMAEYKNFFLEQLLHRRTPDGGITYSVFDFIKYLFTGYGFVFIAAIAGMAFSNIQWNRYFLIILAIPLLHYFLFRGFSNEHDYSVIKWSPFIIIWAVAHLPQLKKRLQSFTIIAMLCFGVFLYQYINPPGQQSFNGERYVWMKEMGQRMAAEARPDEYIFINTPSYYHQIGWYAKRNYLNVKDEAEAKLWLSYQPGSKGIYYELNDDRSVIRTVHFSK